MKTETIILEALGQNAGKYSPVCFAVNFRGDMAETVMRCRSYDDDGLIPVPRYKLATATMPDWMNEQQYLANYIQFTFARAFHPDIANWNETRFFNFLRLDEKYQYFIGWLFNKYADTKNEFMSSIRNRVDAWLNEGEPEGAPKYNTPLSRAQFFAASRYCPLYNAKKISNAVYWSF